MVINLPTSNDLWMASDTLSGFGSWGYPFIEQLKINLLG